MRGARWYLFVIVFLMWGSRLRAQIDARMLQEPAVSQTRIAFVYAGDIWVVSKEGGIAQRLSTPKGEESFPRFSPDGALIAFTAAYDGNEDVYTMPVTGGIPKQITHNPMPDRVLNWYPDGKSILYASSMESGRQRFNQLYRISMQGGLPDKLPVPYGEFGEISPDGKTLAYTTITRDFRTWKRYRGGMAPDIWLFDLQNKSARMITSGGSNNTLPMWHGTTLYFLSDRDENKRANIWAYDTRTEKLRQVTHFTDFDIHFPSIGPTDLVFENAGRLYLLNLRSEKYEPVDVKVVTDRATLKPHLEKVSALITNGDISPSGKRVVLEARGDIFSIPAEHGITMDLTRSPGSAERFPALSPDGKSIAYWSDKTGDYELTIRSADGTGEERTVTKLGPGFRYQIFWSPDSKKVVFVDQAMNINLCDTATGDVVRLDKGVDFYEEALESFHAGWSADSRWITWARTVDGANSAVFVYDTRNSARTQVTSGFYQDQEPVFDPQGKYLYMLTDRSFRPIYGAEDNTWIYANMTQVAAVPLRGDVASPLEARNDVETSGAEETKPKTPPATEGGAQPQGAQAGAAAPPVPVDIDTGGFEARMVILPPPAGNYRQPAALADKVFYLRRPNTGSSDEKTALVYYDVKGREEKTVLPDVDSYAISADGKKILVVKGKDFAIVDPTPDQKMEKKLATGNLEMWVDPLPEWHQIFLDAWRFERDFFYSPAMQGVNWEEMKTRYGALIDQCVTRWDVNFVLGELLGELNSSHSYRGGGELEAPERIGVGMLGVDYALENGAFRIKKIYRGAPWNNEARSPLLEPGVQVKEGDYLLAVNDVPLDAASDPWAAFVGLAGQTVQLTVNGRPTMEGARKVLVRTIGNESALRNLSWIESNRRKVDEATGGKIGYIYVPDTGTEGQDFLYRQFMGQYKKDGLIIDERFNSGGQIPDRFVELLNRPVASFWAVRDGTDWQWPPVANAGPKVMLINGWSGSGGDAFPYYFKEAGLGPLIGRRTWGGLIGVSGAPPLIDGGSVTVPTFRIYSTDGKWIIEGHGVDPDIEVMDDPAKMQDGRDPQLERAIEEIQKLLKEHPPVRPKRPPAQDRSKH